MKWFITIATICLWLFFPAPPPLRAGVVTDMSGRKVVLPDRVERAVALQGALSILCYIGCAEKIIGVENEEQPATRWIGQKGRTYALANPALAKLPAFGARTKPIPEKIINLAPQVIFTGGSASEAKELQRQTGIPVVVLSTGDLGAGKKRFFQSLQLAGSIFDREANAEKFINRIEKEIAGLALRTASLPQDVRKKAYVGGLQFRVGHGLMGTSRDYPPFQMAGAINVVDSLPVNQTLVKGRFTIDTEVFMTLTPDYVFISEGATESVVRDLASPLYRDLPAIKNGRVHGILPYYYSADPATVLAEAWYVGKILYPDLFRDIEIAQKADELYNLFYGRPLYRQMEEIFGGFKPLAEVKWKH